MAARPAVRGNRSGPRRRRPRRALAGRPLGAAEHLDHGAYVDDEYLPALSTAHLLDVRRQQCVPLAGGRSGQLWHHGGDGVDGKADWLSHGGARTEDEHVSGQPTRSRGTDVEHRKRPTA